MLQFSEREDARRPAPEPPPPQADPHAARLLRLQRGAGNQAVVRMLQRTLYNTTTTKGMNPANATAWGVLNPVQKAAVRRMQQDAYQRFGFPSPDHMFAYVVTQIGPIPANLPPGVNALTAAPPVPVVTRIASRRQHHGPHKSLPPGAPAPAAEPSFRAYTRHGRARYTDPTDAPRSNWSHFVDAQVAAAEGALPAPLGPPEQGAYNSAVALARDAAIQLDAVHELPPGAAGLAPALTSAATDNARVQQLLGLFNALMQQELLAVQGGAARTTRMTEMTSASRSLEAALEMMWRLVLKAQQAANPAVGMARTSLPVPNLPRWGPVVGDGIGTWMHALFTPEGTWAAGSKSDTAGNSMPWNVGRLNQRKKASWIGTIYVQGHLLNDHIGGPALAYNLVPLAADGTSGGANHANLSHFYLIENQAKSAVETMLRSRSADAKAMKAARPLSPSQETISKVEYSVVAEFAGHAYRAAPRKRVNDAAAQALSAKLRMMMAARAAPGAVTIDTLNAEARAGISGLDYNRDWTPMKDAIDAVVPLANRPVTTLDELIALLKDNAAHWGYEDATVPSALSVALRIHRAGGDVTPADARIPNVLPQVASQPFVKG